ncbi:1,4-alpha-glucan branching protein [Streptomyces sp. RerS4]|uniref:maltokinase N-terminal cap-like domain-containing protein n=1 Tax=Streptomyces sp. RerS4 TaxID=2942449 RepID=UPI00201BCC5F|nr:1,4-alpha-glucan branching protein [Streptomyces sp. RerS4]UQX03920.1 1,4-alpha-glucan branching protein [Streptomyces sp. RerS4]
MAVIHHTTMSPGKLELLADWLPSRPWYRGVSAAPELAKAGGFRLDDPEGEVGIEFMVVTDTSGGVPVSYLVPLAYRGAPLEGGEAGLIGTSEHGVLGTRWIYDGTRDPVLVAQLLELLAGRATAQDQDTTGAPDPTVEVRAAGSGVPAGARAGAGAVTAVSETETATELTPAASAVLSLSRVLEPGAGPEPVGQGARVLAEWTTPDGARLRGLFALLRGGADH